MSANSKRLKEYILKYSVADNWSGACKEWKLQSIRQEPDGTCVCGQTITDHCMIRNEINGNRVEVGNQCVQHFDDNNLKASCRAAHASLKKLRADPSARAHPELIALCNLRGEAMYLENRRKRNLSVKQDAWILDMNREILRKTS